MNRPKFFTMIKDSQDTNARRGKLYLPSCDITVQTPVFMPVATRGSIKSLTFEDIHEMNYELILHNAYHLTLTPGLEKIKHFGNMKNLTGWKKGLLTDSGGFQVFSLESLRKITEEGVTFKEPVRGNKYFFSPESIIDIQALIGSDIIMPLDECTKSQVDFRHAKSAQERTTRWAVRSKKYITTLNNPPFLFGITQGNLFEELRTKSIQELIDLDFDGYSIGGLSVGENKEQMYHFTQLSTHLLPKNKPRYLMGVGLPANLLECVHLGVDMFDCVIPTRNARHGQAFSHFGKLNMNNSCHRLSDEPIDPLCQCIICQKYSKGYIHHLIKSHEMTFYRLLTYHNLFYLSTLMQDIRDALDHGLFLQFRKIFYDHYQENPPIY